MKKCRSCYRVLLLVTSTTLLAQTPGFVTRVTCATSAFAVARSTTHVAARSTIDERSSQNSYTSAPLRFEENLGQSDSRVKFVSRGAGYTLFLTSGSAVFRLEGPEADNVSSSAVVRMRFPRSRSRTAVSGVEQLQSVSSYFKGSDPKKWLPRVRCFARVHYTELYPGVDLVFYGSRQQLEYDFVLSAGVRPSTIRLKFDGAGRMRVDKTGALVLKTPAGEIKHQKPVAYQMSGSVKREVDVAYKITPHNEVCFSVRGSDKHLPLTIDPVLSYSTYLGGNNGAATSCISVDSSGAAYITGTTAATNFPTTAKAYKTSLTGPKDVFVTKLNSSGTAVLFSSYLGPGEVFGIKADDLGNAYIAGVTSYSAFPTTPGAFDRSLNGGNDGFVAKLNTNPASCTPGSGINCTEALVYSTLIGGAQDDSMSGIDIDSSGAAYVTGRTSSTDFPTTMGVLRTSYAGGAFDAFVTKVNTSGAGLDYSTFLGGDQIRFINTGDDEGAGIKVDSSGNAYVTGTTDSASFPTTPGAFRTSCANCSVFNHLSSAVFDGFVSKLNPTGSGLVYSTYLGGMSQDVSTGISIDSSGCAYVTGSTFSSDFPTTAGSVQSGSGGVFKSSDGGVEWNGTGSGIAVAIGDTVTALATDPTDPSILYAGVFTFSAPESGVLKSTNGGQSWTRINSGFGATNIRALAVAATVPPTVYAGMDVDGVFKSTDGGASWVHANSGLPEQRIVSLAVDPSDPLTIYAGGESTGVSKTTDGGANWTYTGGPGAGALTIQIDPLNPTTVYVGRNNSVDRSTDGGASWTYIGQGISSQTGIAVKALVLDPTAPERMLAGTSSGVFKTTNGAASPWVQSSAGLSSNDVLALAIDRLNPLTIYAGTASGVCKTTDGGNTWKPFNRGLVGTRITALLIDPQTHLTVYAGSNGSSNLFVAKLNSSGTGLTYSTYLANGNNTRISVDGDGNAYVSGSTNGGLPVTDDALRPIVVGDDLFLAKLSASGADLLYASYLGGNSTESHAGNAVDPPGNVYIAGWTDSTNFPTTTGAFQTTKPGINFQGTVSKMVFLATANTDTYAVDPGGTLTVPAPGVLGNDSASGSTLSAALVTAPGSGSLSLSSSGAFVYTPSIGFEGVDSFRYKAIRGDGGQSNTAQVIILVLAGCTNSLSSTGDAFPAQGGSGTVQVTTTAQCNWQAVSNYPSVLTVTAGSSGSGDGAVGFVIVPNTGTATRLATLTVAGNTFVVTQSGGACSYSLSPPIKLFRADGGSSTVALTTGTSCDWSASSNAPWATVTTPATGTGSATVAYSVDQNIGLQSRNTTLTIGDQNLSIQQSGIAAVGLSEYNGDFDGDGRTEFGFYRTGLWGLLKSSLSFSFGSPQFFNWGGAGLQPIVADFDGDARADIGYIVPPSGGQSATYAILRSTTGYSFASGQPLFVPAGFPSLGDTPVVADFDGDGKADPGIWRASQGVWIIPKSSSNYASFIFTQWGQLGDTPVVGEIDGDGKPDIGFYRDGLWGFLKSTQGYSFASPLFFNWGGAGLQPVVGDFDGDGKTDIGYIAPPTGGQSATYAVLKSTTGYSFAAGQPLFVPAGFPSIGDTPAVGDFDGDGKSDPGIWRESQGVWIIPLSSANYGSYIFSQWGQNGDIPMPNSAGKHY